MMFSVVTFTFLAVSAFVFGSKIYHAATSYKKLSDLQSTLLEEKAQLLRSSIECSQANTFYRILRKLPILGDKIPKLNEYHGRSSGNPSYGYFKNSWTKVLDIVKGRQEAAAEEYVHYIKEGSRWNYFVKRFGKLLPFASVDLESFSTNGLTVNIPNENPSEASVTYEVFSEFKNGLLTVNAEDIYIYGFFIAAVSVFYGLRALYHRLRAQSKDEGESCNTQIGDTSILEEKYMINQLEDDLTVTSQNKEKLEEACLIPEEHQKKLDQENSPLENENVQLENNTEVLQEKGEEKVTLIENDIKDDDSQDVDKAQCLTDELLDTEEITEEKVCTENGQETTQENSVTFRGEVVYCKPFGQTTMLEAQVEVNRYLHRLIVGQSGRNIIMIEHVSKARVQMPKLGESSDIISVKGNKESIQCALDMVEAIVMPYDGNDRKDASDILTAKSPAVGNEEYVSFRGKKIYCDPIGPPGFLKANVKFPSDSHSLIVGQSGRNIMYTEKVSQTKIQLPQRHETSDIVAFTGRKDCIQKALNIIDFHLKNSGH